MKKLLPIVALLTLFAVGLSSCNSCSKKKPVLGAKVNVTVKNIFGSPQDGMKVYMFKDVKPTNSTNPKTAAEVATTDLNGQVTFNVNFTQLKITEDKTTVYFAVFYEKDGSTMVAGKDGVMLRNGDVKNVNITIPI